MRPSIQLPCKHFDICGGCKLQDLSYRDQLKKKQKFLEGYFSSLKEPFQFLPIIPSPKVYFYRNKMEFSFGGQGEDLVCGLHSRLNKRKIIDIEECLLFSENASIVLREVKQFFREKSTSSYSTFTHRGFLRYLILRESKTQKDFMVNIVTSSQGSLDRESFREMLLSLRLKEKEITSLIWTISQSLSDAVVPQRWEILYGKDYLEERIGELIFRIPIFSFFQVNPFILEDFFEFIKNLLDRKTEEKVLDLFSGIGTLTLLLGKHSYFVWAIEQDQEAVKASFINASLNNIKNVSFLSSDVRRALFLNLSLWKGKIDLVSINPPRAGLSKKIIKRIKIIAPKRIIYSSCNPKSFIVDLQNFLDSYRIKLIQPFDFFPHTLHIEVLALLERR